MNTDSFKQTKKVADFEKYARYFDALLADLQKKHEDCIFEDENSLSIHSSAPMTRDCLFRLIQKMRGVPNDEIYRGMM